MTVRVRPRMRRNVAIASRLVSVELRLALDFQRQPRIAFEQRLHGGKVPASRRRKSSDEIDRPAEGLHQLIAHPPRFPN